AISLKVMDHTGKLISDLPASAEPGLHRVAWNLSQGRGRPGSRRGAPAPTTAVPAGQRPAAAGRGPAAPAAAGEQEPPPEPPAFLGGGPQVKPGVYRVVLTVDGTEFSQWLRVEADPAEAATIISSGGETGELP